MSLPCWIQVPTTYTFLVQNHDPKPPPKKKQRVLSDDDDAVLIGGGEEERDESLKELLIRIEKKKDGQDAKTPRTHRSTVRQNDFPF